MTMPIVGRGNGSNNNPPPNHNPRSQKCLQTILSVALFCFALLFLLGLLFGGGCLHYINHANSTASTNSSNTTPSVTTTITPVNTTTSLDPALTMCSLSGGYGIGTGSAICVSAVAWCVAMARAFLRRRSLPSSRESANSTVNLWRSVSIHTRPITLFITAALAQLMAMIYGGVTVAGGIECLISTSSSRPDLVRCRMVSITDLASACILAWVCSEITAWLCCPRPLQPHPRIQELDHIPLVGHEHGPSEPIYLQPDDEHGPPEPIYLQPDDEHGPPEPIYLQPDDEHGPPEPIYLQPDGAHIYEELTTVWQGTDNDDHNSDDGMTHSGGHETPSSLTQQLEGIRQHLDRAYGGDGEEGTTQPGSFKNILK